MPSHEHPFDEKVYDANPITGKGRNRNQETLEDGHHNSLLIA